MTDGEMKLALLDYRKKWLIHVNTDGMAPQPNNRPLIRGLGENGFIPTDIYMDVFEILEGGYVDRMWGVVEPAVDWLDEIGIKLEYSKIPGYRITLQEKE